MRFVGLLTWGMLAAALVQLTAASSRSGVLAISTRWQTVLALGWVTLLAFAAALSIKGGVGFARLVADLDRRTSPVVRRKGFTVGLMVLVASLYPVMVFGPAGRFVEGIFPRLLLFWVVGVVLATLARGVIPGQPWRVLAIASLVTFAVVIRLLGEIPVISTYPFSLGWSEASRYYYASLFYSRSIYGVHLNPPELHPSRYLLQSIPFWVPDLPIVIHRLWQSLLWWLLPVATAALLLARFKVAGWRVRFLVGGWIVLYLFQGPVYYHLLVAVVLVLVGLDARRPWRATAFVFLASAWAGISRLNWFPVPAILAGCLYLLETRERARGVASLAWPAAWLVLGVATALGSQAAYIRISGVAVDRFTSSLTSDLLVYRLFPNPTYPLGILPAVIMVSAPLGLSLWWSRRDWLPGLDRWTRIALAASLAAVAVGGVLVSLKIGGGSNLHNVDAYLVLLLLVGASLLLRPPGDPASAEPMPFFPPFRQLAILAAVPVAFAISSGGRWSAPDPTRATAVVQSIAKLAQGVQADGKPVLFISQRHLLTFGTVQGVRVVPDYETVFLMEMAMAGNRRYLDAFHNRLNRHDFGLIVVDRLTTSYQGRDHSFGEENDAWVREVSVPILCAYDLAVRFDLPPVDLLLPKAGRPACPGDTP